jgi:hypothetical protein
MKLESPRDIFKISDLMKIRPAGAELFHSDQGTDGKLTDEQA